MRCLIAALLFLAFPVIEAGAEEMLAWEDCVIEAKRQHPDLAAAFEKVKQNKAAKEVTRSAVLPQVTGNASESTDKNADLSTSTGGTVSAGSTSSRRNPSKTTYEYDLAGKQLLFDGFKTSYDLSAAERSIYSSRYNYDVVSSNIRVNLRTAFAYLLSAQELLRVTAEIEGRRKQNFELVKLRYEGGREHRGSLLTSQADMAQATYEVNQARRNIYLSQRRLTRQLGRSSFTPMLANGALEIKNAERIRPDFEKLSDEVPLLKQLIVQKEAAKFGVKSAYAGLYPSIYADGSIGNTNVDAFPDKNQWSIGTSLTFPFFDGGKTIASISKAKAVLGQADEDERSGRDGVIFTLSNTWTTMQDTFENVEVQREYLIATEERARIARAEYSIGLMSYDNWIIIENNLVSIKKSFVNAQTSALIAEANWIQAKGGTLDYD
ncbi:MAG: TolC family protein [Candidatus Omnitrophica bacterium]|nr:TolC family protein [Candidatus Omnitrophota bacterium]MDD5436666.1 TolC family protein [Candidatus Omnitrophota bacterium]